ncbi:MAG: Gfo/Idh/MocA family oxidoreductase [Bacteroidetes bacterium]|nr:Gfo/Idh/MocA family oxidoreductase [Bacteroidota bacterium]
MNRREFMQNSSLATAGVLVGTKGEAAQIHQGKPKSKLQLGFIGVGMRGRNHVDLALRRDDCEVVGICDIQQVMIDACLKQFQNHGKKKPTVYGLEERAYLEMLQDPAIDAVVISTPWRWHTEMAVASMQAGKYVGMEVCGGFSLDECWQLVNVHEATGTPLFFLENVCYRRDVMAVLNMVREGLFGEMIHLECGYQHDLREVKFNDGKQPYGGGVEFGEKGFSEAQWRTRHSVHRNGELYPTHGIGPVAQYININRGNRITHLTSMASKARGLHEYIVNHEKGGPNHPNASVEFSLGDKVTTMLRTSNGESIVMHHDTSLPRPYSLGFRVQGVKGIWMDLNDKLHIEGKSPKHRWEEAAPWLQKYDHKFWKKDEQKAIGAGHGGMDYFLFNAFIECGKAGTEPPIDVYDAATWLAITPLSEQSITLGSTAVAMPDFTRGRWTMRENNFAKGDW